MKNNIPNETTKKELQRKWQEELKREKDEKGNKEFKEPNFTLLVSSLTMQAMIAMGKLESPITGKTSTNFEQARFLIDTLPVIKEKTGGNLTAEEEQFLENSIFHLRNNYLETKGKE